MGTSNEDLLREFLLETHENLQSLDSDLIALEKNPADKRTLAQVFRTLHSVKGTAGFMGLEKLQAVAHSAESLLSRLRAGELSFDAPIATALLRTVDAIRQMLASIETSGGEGAGDYSALVGELDRLREQFAARVVEEPAPAPSPAPPPESVRVQPEVTPDPPTATLAATMWESPADSAALSEGLSGEVVEPRASLVADSSIRVDVGLLDDLMTSVGELVLARNQILQYSTTHGDDEFVSTVQRLNRLTAELQANVMKTRMQPIGNVLSKFPRIVRDLAIACGKKVRLEIDGQETELDKTLIEAIRDPLTHMVRNAVDHGIESPEVRKACGKPEEGRLRIKARHDGGKVVVEISDDGGGIDTDRVRAKAIAANLISPEAAAEMSPQEALRLIFLPGFSTADRVTQYSGRGVGMDVVRTNIERIGGTVDLESVKGEGAAIRTKIPLTLAIIPALIVVSGGERFAVPQASLLELVLLESDGSSGRIERVQGAPVYRLRGSLLPIVYLNEQLELASEGPDSQEIYIVVLQTDDRPFGLVVDSVRDVEEIVVKPLQKQLKGVRIFSGAAIMGDGRVALTLDVRGLALRANVVSATRRATSDRAEEASSDAAVEDDPSLCFEPVGGGRMAMRLSRVARLEEFSREELERVGGRPMIQYRGGIMPLVNVSKELERLATEFRDESDRRSAVEADEDAYQADETIRVVVCEVENQYVGLIVGKIVDIVHEPPAARSRSGRQGVSFAAVLQERVTEFLDVDAVVRGALSDYSRPV